MPVIELKTIRAFLSDLKVIPILVSSELIESTYFPHSNCRHLFALFALFFQEWPFEKKIGDWRVMACMLAEYSSSIIIVALIRLTKQWIERFELFDTSIHPSDDRGDH